MHRTVQMVLLSMAVAGAGFLTTSIAQLQQSLTPDSTTSNLLQNFQLVPQFCGEACALLIWYFAYRRKDQSAAPPPPGVRAATTAGDGDRDPIALSASTIVDGKPIFHAANEPLLPSAAGAAAPVSDDRTSAVPFASASASGSASAFASSTPVSDPSPLLPASECVPRGTGAGVDITWYELVFWAFALAICDMTVTLGFGRYWVMNGVDTALRTVYLIATPLLSRIILGVGVSRTAMACVALSCAGFLLNGLGGGGLACETREELTASGGDTGVIDASVSTICGVGVAGDAILHFGVTALETVLEERLMRKHSVDPVFLIGIEGVAGLIVSGSLFAIAGAGHSLVYWTAGTPGLGQFFSQSLWWLTSAGLMLFVLLFNVPLMLVTYYSSATMRTFIESSRLSLAWAGEILVGWNQISWYNPPAYAMVVAGALIYFWVTEHERLMERIAFRTQRRAPTAPAAYQPLSGGDAKSEPDFKSEVSVVVVSPSPAVPAPNAAGDPAPVLAPAPVSGPHPVAVGFVVAGSLGYFIYLHVLCYQTGALSRSDTVGSIVMLFLVTALFVVRPGIPQTKPLTAAAGDTPLIPSADPLSMNVVSRGVSGVSISGNVRWGQAWSYRLITIIIYWCTWAVFVPLFALLINQTIFSEPTPLGTNGYSANFVTNVLRSFSAVVLAWCLLPLRSITVAYGRREVLTRVVLDLVDAFNLVDPAVILLSRSDGGAGLNPNDLVDSVLLSASVLFAGLTLLLIAVIGAASGLQDLTSPLPTATAAPSGAAVVVAQSGAGPDPSRPPRRRSKRDSQSDVQLFWVLLPYVASIVVNNVPFLVLRVIIWSHTGYLSVALLAKNVLGVLLCAFFIGSTYQLHVQQSQPLRRSAPTSDQ